MMDQKDLYHLAVQKLRELAEVSHFTAGEREAHEERLKYYRDSKNVVDTSREEGREEGRKEGSKEQAITIARRMLAAGVGVEQVAEFTGLGVERVRALLEE